jgi:dTMP kinase
MSQGLFIVFEGGDGAGKSTHTALLAEWLQAAGHTVVTTREPGGTPLGDTIRRILLDPASGDIAPRAEALLYAADKAHHVYELIGPALERGDIVISDRYVDSMIAYQGAGRILDPDEVAWLGWWGVGGLRPDLTILLDVPVEQGLGEIAEPDRLEQAGTDLHERVRAFYLGLAAKDPEAYLVVDRSRPKAEVAAAIRDRVARLLAVA